MIFLVAFLYVKKSRYICTILETFILVITFQLLSQTQIIKDVVFLIESNLTLNNRSDFT
jgi:hypothetical protein